MSIASYNQFQYEVMQDLVLQEQLKAVAATAPEKLGKVAIELGAERGYSFTLEDIQAAAEAISSPGTEAVLKEEELEMVAGGSTATPFSTLGLLGKEVGEDMDEKGTPSEDVPLIFGTPG